MKGGVIQIQEMFFLENKRNNTLMLFIWQLFLSALQLCVTSQVSVLSRVLLPCEAKLDASWTGERTPGREWNE